METIVESGVMQEWAGARTREGKRIGFVPTMGALHEGHLSLIRLAKKSADLVVVSIFVNPTQFGPNEDFSKYPRERESDLAKCEAEGADVVFCPEAGEFYGKGFSTFVVEESVGVPLEGRSRPTHFRGVTTVVAKLFNVVMPDLAFFGQKDVQQVAVIKRMARDLNFRVKIVTGETVREADGLAMSSRNRYLAGSQRAEALGIHRALAHAKEMVAKGERRVDRIEAEVTHMLGEQRRVRVIYVSIVDRETMAAVKGVLEAGTCVLTVAAWVDEVRLIDNELL